MADKLTRNGIRPTQGELLQDVILKGRSRDGSGHDNGQCTPNPLTVEKEKQLVVHNRAAHTAHRGGSPSIAVCGFPAWHS
jgi:hypothetical protein